MPSYRRHIARHPLALARALRAVRAHAMQTGPVSTEQSTYMDCWHRRLPVSIRVQCGCDR